MLSVLTISFWNWLERLGGIGLILLGLADNSPLPMPGSMDVLTVLLSAHQKSWWPYYAVMATLGGITGGYATFVLAREGGKRDWKRDFPKSGRNWPIGNSTSMDSGACLFLLFFPRPSLSRRL